MSLCPEFDIASQGDTIEEARENLREALELFFETASSEEIQTRLHEEVYVTRMEDPIRVLPDGSCYRIAITDYRLLSDFHAIGERFLVPDYKEMISIRAPSQYW